MRSYDDYLAAYQAGQVPEGMTFEQWASMSAIASNIPTEIAKNQTAGESWVDTATKLLTGFAMYQNQRDLYSLNLELVRQGKNPIDPSRIAGMGVNVGLSQNTQQLVTYALLGLGAFLVFNTLMRR